MNAEGWERVAEAFEAALACAPEERGPVLVRLCGEDAELRAEVEALLASASAAGDEFLAGSPWAAAPAAPAGPDDAPPRWAPGELLAGRFEIVRLLGRGGMGEVYAARDRELGGEVALKAIAPAAAADPRALARFKREILTARRISHPQVCRIHDLALESGAHGRPAVYFLTMELVEGETLRDYLRREGRAGEAEAARWLAEMASGLDAAHAAGVVHRDFKPGNVILRPGDDGLTHAVVTDFGLALWAGPAPAADAGQPSGTRLVGTLAYMAPEQWTGGAITPAADVYAFGLVAYEVLTGRAPFAGTFVPPSQAAEGIAPAWDTVIAHCLRQLPAERPTGAGAALALLAECPPEVGRVRRALWWRASAWAAAAALAMALGIGLWRFRQQRPHVAAGAELLLTPIANSTSDAQLDGATTLLRQQLAQSGRFALTSDAQIEEQFRRMRRPDATPAADAAALAAQPSLAREVAMRRGAPLVLFGGLSQVAGTYRLDLELEQVGHDPDAAAHRWSHQETATGKSDLFDAVHSAAVWVRTMAGEQADALASTDQPPQDVTTASWEALAYYDRAERERAAGRTPQAIALLQQAVALDPGFALAYSFLGDIQVEQRLLSDGYADYEKALALASSKRRLSQRERLRLQFTSSSDLGDYPKELRAAKAYAALYPSDPLGWFYQGISNLQTGYPELAREAWQHARQLSSDQGPSLNGLGQLELWEGHWGAAASVARDLLRAGQPGLAHRIAGSAAAGRGDFAGAEREWSALAAMPDAYWRARAALLECDTQAELGRYDRALAALMRGMPSAIDVGHGMQAQFELATAYLQSQSHRPVSSAGHASAALKLDQSPAVALAAGTLLARNGRIADAAAVLRGVESSPQLPPLSTLVEDRLRGEIQLANSHFAAAIALFQRAHALAGNLDDEEYLARGYAAAGRFTEAEAIYRRWAGQPGRVWWWPMGYPPGELADLTLCAARLSRKLDLPDFDSLRRRYRQLRAGADPDLRVSQPVVKSSPGGN